MEFKGKKRDVTIVVYLSGNAKDGRKEMIGAPVSMDASYEWQHDNVRSHVNTFKRLGLCKGEVREILVTCEGNYFVGVI